MTTAISVEICSPGAEAALKAQETGADRVELCRDLQTGGLTPSYDDIILAGESLHIDLNVLIRPREGDFVYNAKEVATMLEQIRFCGESGLVDGVVIGALTPSGEVDIPVCGKLVEEARKHSLSVTFHRAIDEPGDIFGRLRDVMSLGVDRVLSSGGAATAEEGIPVLKEMVRLSAGRVSVMPGCGVTPDNAVKILNATLAHEIHGSRAGIIAAVRASSL